MLRLSLIIAIEVPLPFCFASQNNIFYKLMYLKSSCLGQLLMLSNISTRMILLILIFTLKSNIYAIA